ncbi:MAG: transcription antitermination factor NusB, partial [Raineya sp.]|nr:transcription antitermination factor NusB [Raineya sp.]
TALQKQKRELTAFIPKDLSIYQFSENKILAIIAQNKIFQDFITRRNISIDQELIKTFWQEFKDNEQYKSYYQNASPSIEQDWAIVDYLFRHFLFHKEANEDNPEQKSVLKAFFEENDLNWIENREILKSLVLKTLKKVKENPENFELPTLSLNWQDDKEFFRDLFEKTLQESEHLEKRIAEKTQNWESDRLFQTDKILIMMGLAEMIHCPSIPVKVTINEYVELAKQYSTPKSKIFVNGLLDRISKDLLQEGIIRKSGKGLLDNR